MRLSSQEICSAAGEEGDEGERRSDAGKGSQSWRVGVRIHDVREHTVAVVGGGRGGAGGRRVGNINRACDAEAVCHGRLQEKD